jgi:protein ImuB
MSLREAQLRCPKAILVADDRPRYGKAFLPVIDALDCFSPQVEETDLGMAFADATGLTLLYGPDLALCRKIQIAIRESTVHQVNVGLAGSKFAAEIVARTADPSGIGAVLETDAMHLAQLPLTMLPLSKKTIKQLHLLGVCDLGAFAALPANTVRSKYGAEGHIAQKMASGLDERPIKPRFRPLGFEETTEFEWGEQNLDRMTFSIQSMATRLAHRLESCGLLARRIQTDIVCSDCSRQTFILNLPEPTAQAQILKDAVCWRLAANKSSSSPTSKILEDIFEINSIRIQTTELIPFEGKHIKLFANRANRIDRANQSISHLQALLGNEAVFRSELRVEERVPEQGFVYIDAYLPQFSNRAPRRATRPITEHFSVNSGGILRLCEPPILATMLDDHIYYGGRLETVIGCYGPHRLRSNWGKTLMARDYYRVLLSNGGGLLIYRDSYEKQWLVQGVVD